MLQFLGEAIFLQYLYSTLQDIPQLKAFFLVPALLRDCSLCWDMMPTLDVALLISSRAVADLGRASVINSYHLRHV